MRVGSKVLIFLAGADMDRKDMAAWAAGAELILAADGGVDLALESGFTAHMVVGDLDSASIGGRMSAEIILHKDGQDHTDCEKALTYCEEHHIGAEVLVLGSEGSRLDHVLATLLTVMRSPLRPTLALRAGLGFGLNAGQQLTLDLSVGSTVSLLPLATCTASLTGVVWPFEDRQLGNQGGWSISNRAVDKVHASVTEGSAVLIVEVRPGTWPSEVLR